jgi:hypothetical protein
MNTEGAIKKNTIQRNWQHRPDKKKNTKNITQYVLDTNVNKTLALLQITP